MSKHPNFYPVILAGGRGTRFWPLSRKKRAKQLLALDGTQTMIQQTVARLTPLSPTGNFWVITNEDLRPAIVKQLPKLPKAHVLAEPVAAHAEEAGGLALNGQQGGLGHGAPVLAPAVPVSMLVGVAGGER